MYERLNRTDAAGLYDAACCRAVTAATVKAAGGSDAAKNAAIEADLRRFYAAGNVDAGALQQAVRQVQTLYRSNVFPAMNVKWGVYVDNIGHTTSNGCFRCHDGSHVARDGSSISADCSYCHDMK